MKRSTFSNLEQAPFNQQQPLKSVYFDKVHIPSTLYIMEKDWAHLAGNNKIQKPWKSVQTIHAWVKPLSVTFVLFCFVLFCNVWQPSFGGNLFCCKLLERVPRRVKIICLLFYVLNIKHYISKIAHVKLYLTNIVRNLSKF